MTDTSTVATDPIVRFTRRFDAPREDVYRAWTDPAEVAQWYGPDGWHAERIRIIVTSQRPPTDPSIRMRSACQPSGPYHWATSAGSVQAR